MQIYNRLSDIPELNHVVMTIGTFDGVHLGHQKLLSEITQRAKSIDGTSVLLSFHPHPRMVLEPDRAKGIKLLTTIDERIELLQKTDLDVLVLVPFSVQFANLPAEQYVDEVLIKHFHPKEIVIGYDHHFGKGRTGNIHLLEKLQSKYHYKLCQIDKQTLADITYSSTNIRNDLKEGKIKQANQLLGYHYSLRGIVERGDQIGRTIGFPTANLHIQDQEKLIPANGVYAIKTIVDGQQYNGMLNIGIRPTFLGTKKTIEAHLFDFHQAIYGEYLTILLFEFLRNEQKFDSKEALVEQLNKDKQNALKVLQNV